MVVTSSGAGVDATDDLCESVPLVRDGGSEVGWGGCDDGSSGADDLGESFSAGGSVAGGAGVNVDGDGSDVTGVMAGMGAAATAGVEAVPSA